MSSSSLVQPVANGVVKSRSLPREGSDQDEVTFDVKLDQGLSGTGGGVVLAVYFHLLRPFLGAKFALRPFAG